MSSVNLVGRMDAFDRCLHEIDYWARRLLVCGTDDPRIQGLREVLGKSRDEIFEAAVAAAGIPAKEAADA